MIDFKGLEIKTAAQFAEWVKGVEFTAIRSDWGTPATNLFDRYAAQERAAREMWPKFRAAMIEEARRCWPNAKITEIGDEILIDVSSPLPLIDDPQTDGLAPSDLCPECGSELALPDECPNCGWASLSR